MSKSVSWSSLTRGSWIARFGAWQINIYSVRESWHVRIWSYLRSVARVQITKRAAFATAAEAVAWACEVLRERGTVAFCDGRMQPLERFLAFTLAPGDILCS